MKTLVLTLSIFLLPGWAVLAGPPADPFAGVAERQVSENDAHPKGDLFTDNFGFRRELMSEFGASEGCSFSSRQSVGGEVLKKFSDETATIAGLDLQLRLVRRDGFIGLMNDMEGMGRPGWFLELHNAYLDLYDLFGGPGRARFRLGRFYLPFGLNFRTDTHGTFLQLSNEEDFGFERDWLAGFSGFLTEGLDYDAYYLAGSGYEPRFAGQGGLGALRIGLSERSAAETGLEGGLSFLAGSRLVGGKPVDTWRGGLDGRWRAQAAGGTLTFTNELNAGQDDGAGLYSQLHQLDYLRGSRRWGLAAQYRRAFRDLPGTQGQADASLALEATWYFRNDVGNSNLHWVKASVEFPAERREGGKAVLAALQYYQYW